MSAPIYIFSITAPLVAILLVFGMRYWSAVQQAKARLANDEAYRELAEKAAAAQADTAAALAEVRTRLAGVEKILKDVE